MGVGRVPGLLLLVSALVVLTTLRARAENCGEREYFHEDRCCVFCEAGTFVANHCSASHSRGKCDPCKEGEDFTAHENGLEGCLPCRQCKEGQVNVRPCTLTQNAECQCKQGYFCADEGCEICQRHSQMHPDREEVRTNCSDATDPGCGEPNRDSGTGHIALVILILLVLGLGLLPVWFRVLRKRKCNKAASIDKDAEGGLTPGGMCSCDATSCDSYKVQELKSQIIVKDLSQRELRDTFGIFIKEVPPHQWKQLMKTHLQKNEIDKIISKFPDNREEQSYQMLLIWRNTLGKKQCIINLLDALRHIDTKAYYNISKTLKINNIISEVEAED